LDYASQKTLLFRHCTHGCFIIIIENISGIMS